MSDSALNSPYLQYDPGEAPQFNFEPQYISLKNTQRERGRFELAFGQIGTSYLLGGALGVIGGMLAGLKEAKHFMLQGRLRRTHVVNHILKGSGAWGQVAGTLALLYSLAGMALVLMRGCDDDLTIAGSASTTGLLYQSSGGLKKSLCGGLFGLGASSPLIIWNNRDDIRRFLKKKHLWRREDFYKKEMRDVLPEDFSEAMSEYE